MQVRKAKFVVCALSLVLIGVCSDVVEAGRCVTQIDEVASVKSPGFAYQLATAGNVSQRLNPVVHSRGLYKVWEADNGDTPADQHFSVSALGTGGEGSANGANGGWAHGYKKAIFQVSSPGGTYSGELNESVASNNEGPKTFDFTGGTFHTATFNALEWDADLEQWVAYGFWDVKIEAGWYLMKQIDTATANVSVPETTLTSHDAKIVDAP